MFPLVAPLTVSHSDQNSGRKPLPFAQLACEQLGRSAAAAAAVSTACWEAVVASASAAPGDVVDHERPGSAAVVGAGDGPEALLPRRVPDLQLDLLAAHFDDPRAELHADCVGAVRHDCGGGRNARVV